MTNNDSRETPHHIEEGRLRSSKVARHDAGCESSGKDAYAAAEVIYPTKQFSHHKVVFSHRK